RTPPCGRFGYPTPDEVAAMTTVLMSSSLSAPGRSTRPFVPWRRSGLDTGARDSLTLPWCLAGSPWPGSWPMSLPGGRLLLAQTRRPLTGSRLSQLANDLTDRERRVLKSLATMHLATTDQV